jgi:uncharacterized protein
MIRIYRNAIGALICVASIFNSHAASFDCSKASTAVEGSICANPTLSALDEKLAAAYKQAVAASPNPASLLDGQRAWLKTLNACGANVPCLTNTYEQRIAVLASPPMQPVAAPLFPAPTQLNQVVSPTSSTQTSNAQVATLDGNWHSPQWKYGYVLKDGMGVATTTNSPNFQVGQNIIQLTAASPNTFTGQQVYTDGKFYKVTATLLPDGRLSFAGEKNVKWVMERIGAPPQPNLSASQTTAPAPSAVSTLQLPLAQATQTQPAASPLFPAPTQSNQVVSPASSTQTSNSGSGNQPKVQTVVAEGVGIDIQSASQNAARNALTNVVGSLIDTQSMLNKRTQIEDGIRTQTKAITSTIREYSQGSIQSFEILDTKNEGGLYRVSAKVSVRIEDFRAYIKKLAEGETAVQSGLFTQAQTATSQNTNKLGLLNDLLRPLIDGEVIQFVLDKPVPLSNSKYKGEDDTLNYIIKQNGSENVFFIPVAASIDSNFLANMKRVVKSTSSANISAPLNSSLAVSKCKQLQGDSNVELAVPIAFFDSAPYERARGSLLNPNGFIDIYMIENVRNGLLMPLPTPKSSTTLEVVILDQGGSILQREQYSSPSQRSPRIQLFGKDRLIQNDVPWAFVMQDVRCFRSVSVVASRSFTLGIAIDPKALQQAQKIVVRLVK